MLEFQQFLFFVIPIAYLSTPCFGGLLEAPTKSSFWLRNGRYQDLTRNFILGQSLIFAIRNPTEPKLKWRLWLCGQKRLQQSCSLCWVFTNCFAMDRRRFGQELASSERPSFLQLAWYMVFSVSFVSVVMSFTSDSVLLRNVVVSTASSTTMVTARFGPFEIF